MTHAEQIMHAVAHIAVVQGFTEFSRDDVRLTIGVEAETWLNRYTAIFQGMRIDHPGRAPDVGQRFRGILHRVGHGRYKLTEKGERLARELPDERFAAALR